MIQKPPPNDDDEHDSEYDFYNKVSSLYNWYCNPYEKNSDCSLRVISFRWLSVWTCYTIKNTQGIFLTERRVFFEC